MSAWYEVADRAVRAQLRDYPHLAHDDIRDQVLHRLTTDPAVNGARVGSGSASAARAVDPDADEGWWVARYVAKDVCQRVGVSTGDAYTYRTNEVYGSLSDALDHAYGHGDTTLTERWATLADVSRAYATLTESRQRAVWEYTFARGGMTDNDRRTATRAVLAMVDYLNRGGV